MIGAVFDKALTLEPCKRSPAAAGDSVTKFRPARALRIAVAMSDSVKFEDELAPQTDAALTGESFCLFADSNMAETRGRFEL
jgi:hypothetical protein